MNIKSLIKNHLPYYKQYSKTCGLNPPFGYLKFLLHKCGLFNRKTYWYYPKTCWIGMPKRIYVGKGCFVGRPYNFFQAYGGIYIGNYVQFATRVSLLTSNHDIYNQYIRHHSPIVIGDYCWLGMNTTILAGVELGPRTIVAAGAVVNKSFPEGFCILGGVPAKVIKKLDREQFDKLLYEKRSENYGYLSSEVVESDPQKFLKNNLDTSYFHVVNGKIVLKK